MFQGYGVTKISIDHFNLEDFNSLKDFIKKNEIDFIVIGPEKPLVDGIVDYFNDTKIKIFGEKLSVITNVRLKIF